MANLFWTFIAFLLRALHALRYRVKFVGLEQLNSEKLNRKGGILFMPNHAALIDPILIYIKLWPKYKMRPLVIEYVYRLPFMQPFMKLVKGLPVPAFESAVNQIKIKKAQESLQAIAEGLKGGGNYVLYPSGRLKSSGKEALGGASGAHSLVQECPDANIVLVRTSGLWGSSFSRALLGRSPEILPTLWHGAKVILKNFLLFTPRRTVTIELSVNPDEMPRSDDRLEFNRYLENWYNSYIDDEGNRNESEPLKLVSYSVFKEDLPEVYTPKKRGEQNNGNIEIQEDTRTKIYTEIQRLVGNPSLEISPEMSLAANLGMDSLNIAEMIAFLAHHYDIGELHPEEIETVQDVLEAASGVRNSSGEVKKTSLASWPEESGRPEPQLPLGKSCTEAFFNVCQRMQSHPACGDDVVGVLSYNKLKRAVLVLAQFFRTLPEDRIAVMLPASCGAYITILALQCAGKVPVMLNWTLGPRYLEEMMNLTGAKAVISSWRFIDRVSHVEFGNLVDKIQFLEDIRKKLTLGMKLRGLFLTFCPTQMALRSLGAHKFDENDPAVVLFTSGTEANPKGVPLSHKNILSNERSAMQCLDLKRTDTLYGILPPFHSFGFSVVGLFPLFAGIKVAFYPDPTDSFALAEGAQRWKVTLFCGTPSFVKGLFSAAKKEQIKTVRLFISGAEKAPPELYQRVERLGQGVKLIEGYGITECAPVLTVTRLNLPPKGVGSPLPDIDFCTIHPETLQLLSKGEEGEFCVRGPNVFNGYLGKPRDPFIEIEGKKWYRTGDIGYLDKDNNVIISGRMKRFTKVGGEMISLGAIEEVIVEELLAKGQINSDVPSIAIIADERNPDKSQLILFTTVSFDKDSANQILSRAGFSRLVKISDVKQIEEIPLMGTGKTDYRKLQSYLT